MKILIVIPANTNLQDFPESLKKILNKELILWVSETCRKLTNRSIRLVVATDNKKILILLKKRNRNNDDFSKYLIGTDRVAEVSKN